MTEEQIKALEKVGFKRWQKGDKDRLYIDATQLGLECNYYNTGNISMAWFNGERISNSQGGRLKSAKTYIDVNTGKLYGTNSDLKKAAEELVAKVENGVE